MNRYKGIIFDLDGTLLDTLTDISDSTNKALTDYELPNHTYEQYKLILGYGFRSLIESSVPKGTDPETINMILESFLKNYNINFNNKTAPYPGIDEMLYSLSKMGIKMGVNSNKRDDYTKQLVAKHFSRIPFIAVFGERSGINRKPDPVAALEIAQLMELKPEEILYIGDSKTDIMVAINAKMDGVGVLWGFRDYNELKEYGAKYIVSEPKEILEITKKINIDCC